MGTITETLFDGLGHATQVWVGTTAGLTETESEQYDNNGVGDGDLTQEIQYTNARTPNHVTLLYYDWRDRLVAQNNGLQLTYNTLDNLGEITESDVYSAAFAGTVLSMANGVPQPPAEAGGLLAKTTTAFDNQVLGVMGGSITPAAALSYTQTNQGTPVG